MKIVLAAAILSAVSCTVDQPTTPTTMPRSDWPVFEACGRPPVAPRYVAFDMPGDPANVKIDRAMWATHVDWAVAITAWAECADASQ